MAIFDVRIALFTREHFYIEAPSWEIARDKALELAESQKADYDYETEFSAIDEITLAQTYGQHIETISAEKEATK
jgi:hypothetical protein